MRNRIAALALALLAACDGAVIYSDPIDGLRTRDEDTFARAFLDQMQARSFEVNREFCGYFGRDAEGYLIATDPVLGEIDTCRPPEPAPGFGTFASYHSHGGYDVDADSEVPSTYDVLADRFENVIGYISTPGGRVWRTDDGVARQICGRGCISVDPDFVPRVYGPVQRRYTLVQLQKRESS